jgi:hypothetical protein
MVKAVWGFCFFLAYKLIQLPFHLQIMRWKVLKNNNHVIAMQSM